MDIYLTLDYELFLGEKTGTPENCLVRPMDELCKVADRHNFKFVIFVDAAYLLRMQQLKGQFKEIDHQYDLVSNHVKSLAIQGHDVQLHFHPQWLYSYWDVTTQQWKMNRDHYKLSDLSLEEAKSSLSAAKELLDELVGYTTTAFRAGGYCLDTFYEYKELFKELGLKVDSSVARYSFVESPVHSYDYRVIPHAQLYRFSDSVKEENPKGDFVELSISSFQWDFVTYYFKIRPQRAKYHPSIVYKDGEGIKDRGAAKNKNLLSILKRKNIIASFDWEWSNLLETFLIEAKKKGQNEIVFIAHPKNASDVSIKNLDSFISSVDYVEIKTTRKIVV